MSQTKARGTAITHKRKEYAQALTRGQAILLSFLVPPMSSVTFPSASFYGVSSIHSNSGDEDSPYHSGFDTTHGIQMNPLSQHPPRTPRTSTAYSSGYDLSGPSPMQASTTLDIEEEEEHVHDHPAKAQVTNEEVWREIIKTSDGRDKAFVRRVTITLPPRLMV